MRAVAKPDFLIIGAAKAATTTLSNLLAAHPQAGIVQGKEPHFFSYDQVYSAGWEYYQGLYRHCEGVLAVGDASTSYSRIRYHPNTIARIMKHVPDVKIVYMVRNPLERMVSAYAEWLATPGNPHIFKSINHAVKQQPMIVDSSRYWEVFDCYRKNFGESRIKIVWFEEFVKDTQGVFSGVCEFLGIEPGIEIDTQKINLNSRDTVMERISRLGRGDIEIKTKWDKKVFRWVVSQIRDDNTRFLNYFGKSTNYWSDLSL